MEKKSKEKAAVAPTKAHTSGKGVTLCTEYITPEALTVAERLFNQMGIGREHAVYVNSRDTYDKDARAFRALVAAARKAGTPIIAGGDGWYWIADPDNPDDRDAIKRQIASLTSRGYAALDAAQAMAEALEGRYM